ncbi:MAG: MlaD family protein [Phycisphaerae bacterium]
MKESKRNVLVGLFVLLGFGGLIALVLLFGNHPTWMAPANTYPLEIQFRNAGGIRVGNIVTVNGIEVGRVTSIGLYDPQNLEADFNVRVVVAIQNQFKIPDGSSATTNEPVLGQGRPDIQIVPGTGGLPLSAGARITGRVLGAVETLFPSDIVSTFTSSADQIRVTGAALTPVLDDLHKILRRQSPDEVDRFAEVEGNLSSAVARFDDLMKHLNLLIGDEDTNAKLRASVANLYTMTEDGKEAMGDFRLAASDTRALMENAATSLESANRTLASIEGTSNDLRGRIVNSLTKVDQFMDTMNRLMLPISRGEGTLGRMLSDNDLYDALVITLKRFAATITDFQVLAKEWQKGKVRITF